MRYRVVVLKKVQKSLDKISEPYQGRMKLVFAWLETNPDLGKHLSGNRKGEWSYRVGPFRILYRMKNEELIVIITAVGSRRDIYS